MKIKFLGWVLLLNFFAVSIWAGDYELKHIFPFKFSNPIFMSSLPGYSSGMAFAVIEKKGKILVALNKNDSKKNGRQWEKIPLLDMQKKVCSKGYEQGLLSFVFAPDFKKSNNLYIYYCVCGPNKTVLSRIHLDESLSLYLKKRNRKKLIKYTEEILLEISQPYSNHNGGHLAFDKKGYLYLSVGDGGSGGDPKNNAQNLHTYLGKILRLNVNVDRSYKIPKGNPYYSAKKKRTGGKLPEIYAYGLRNTWRYSFDKKTGLLWAADVGQSDYEEVSVIKKGGNYGWRLMEGFHCYDPKKNCYQRGLVLPVFEYSHQDGQSITGGYVYRGKNIPSLYGKYIFADYVNGNIWSISSILGDKKYKRTKKINQRVEKQITKFRSSQLLLKSGVYISSFAEDNDGELYILGLVSGKVFKLIEKHRND